MCNHFHFKMLTGYIIFSLLVLISSFSLWSSDAVLISFESDCNDNVKYSIYYSTQKTEPFAQNRMLVKEVSPGKQQVEFECSVVNLHKVRLDIDSISGKELTAKLSNFKIEGNGEYAIEDFSREIVYSEKEQPRSKGNNILLSCKGGEDVYFIVKKELDIKKKFNISIISVVFIITLCALFYWSVLKFIKNRKRIASIYSSRNSAATGSPKFYTHLEGLRGLAIVLVVLYHLGSTGINSPISLQGGYLGVEMFLVLTGFLLASSFLYKHESFLSFFRKKVLRLMCPVSLLIILTLFVCLFCMDYEDIKRSASNAVYALFGVTNIQLSADGAEYFAVDQTYNPLLHLWYVAITLQLYLLFYFGYVCLWPLPKSVKTLILVSIASISFIYGNCHELRAELVSYFNLPFWISKQGSMYYSTLARLWEPILGVAILFVPCTNNKKLSFAFCLVAISTILYCVCYLPSQSMLLTACSTAILIRYGEIGFCSNLLNNRIVRFMGKISFSVYLVHMPLFVCYKCASLFPLNIAIALILLFASVVLGLVYWRYVESRKIQFKSFIAIWFSCLIISQLLIYTDGLRNYWNVESNKIEFKRYDKFRFRHDNNLIKQFSHTNMPSFPPTSSLLKQLSENTLPGAHPFLQIGDETKKPSFILIGDSHAFMSYAGIDVLCKEAKISGVLMNTLMLPILDRNFGPRRHPYSINKQKMECFMTWLSHHPEITEIVAIFSYSKITMQLKEDWTGKICSLSTGQNMNCIKLFLQRIKGLNKRVILFTPYPQISASDCPRYARTRMRIGLHSNVHPSAYTVTRAAHNHKWKEVISALKSFEKEQLCTLIDVEPYFFQHGEFHAANNGKIHYLDGNHISSDVMIEMFDFLRKNVVAELK